MPDADDKTLLELGREKFGTTPKNPFVLTEAEEFLLREVEDGGVAPFVPGTFPFDPGAPPYPKEDLGRTDPRPVPPFDSRRTLRAEVVQWLLTDRKAKEKIGHSGVTILGTLVEGTLDLSYSEMPFPVRFHSCVFQDPILAQQAGMKELSLQGSAIPGLILDRIKVAGGVFLNGGFHATGQVRLLGAEIGLLSCKKATFENRDGFALSADRFKVAGNVFLEDGFHATGEVRLSGADIGGQLSCKNAIFLNPGKYALFGQGMVVKDSCFFHQDTAFVGDVDLNHATIEMGFYWGPGSRDRPFLDRLEESLRGLREGAPAVIEGTKEAIQRLERRNDEGGPNLSGMPVLYSGRLILIQATIGTLEIVQSAKAPGERFELVGLTYSSIGRRMPVDSRSEHGKALEWWKGFLKKEKGFSPQPYEQAAKVLREQGHGELAKGVLVEKEERRHDTLPESEPGWGTPMVILLSLPLYFLLSLSAPYFELAPAWLYDFFQVLAYIGFASWAVTDIHRVRRIAHTLYGRSLGYGYRPSRLIRPTVVILGIVWVAASIGYHKGLVVPVEKDTPISTAQWSDPGGQASDKDKTVTLASERAYWAHKPVPKETIGTAPDWDARLPRGFPRFQPLFFAIETFVPLVDLGQREFWQAEPHHYWGVVLRWFFWIVNLTGWAISSVLAATFAGILKR